MKSTSIRFTNLDLERIEEMKQYYSDCWAITPEEISTTEIVSWSLGIAHLIKVQYDISLQNYPNLTKEQYHSRFFEQMNENKSSKNNKNATIRKTQD